MRVNGDLHRPAQPSEGGGHGELGEQPMHAIGVSCKVGQGRTLCYDRFWCFGSWVGLSLMRGAVLAYGLLNKPMIIPRTWSGLFWRFGRPQNGGRSF